MAKIEVYSGFLCSYCFATKRLLKRKGAEFEEIKVGFRPDLRAAMMERAGGRHTVPQIFIDDIHIGGWDDLHALDAAGSIIVWYHRSVTALRILGRRASVSTLLGNVPPMCLYRCQDPSGRRRLRLRTALVDAA